VLGTASVGMGGSFILAALCLAASRGGGETSVPETRIGRFFDAVLYQSPTNKGSFAARAGLTRTPTPPLSP